MAIIDQSPLFLPPTPAIVRAANLDSIRPWREAIEENRRLPYWKARQERFKEKQEAMLRGFIPVVPAFLALKCAPLQLTYVVGLNDTANASSYSYASTSLGTAHPLRWVGIGILVDGTTLDTASVAGTNITLNLDGGVPPARTGYIYTPTGTTATVACACAGTSARNAMYVWRIVGMLKGTPLSTGTIGPDATSSQTIVMAGAKGGAGIVCSRGFSNANAFSPETGTTGYTSEQDTGLETTRRIQAGSMRPTVTESYTLTLTNAAASNSSACMWSP